jgi:hypothetical protein
MRKPPDSNPPMRSKRLAAKQTKRGSSSEDDE